MAYRGPDPKPQSLSAIESDSGGDVKVSASNTSNTADSTATIEAKVAGSSSGDPKVQMVVNGVTTWSIGSDNSDSDKLKVAPSAALETSTALTVDTSGNLEASGDVTTNGDLKVIDSGNTGTISFTPTGSRTLTLPDTTDTLVGKATTDTLTNKTLKNPIIADTTDATKDLDFTLSGATTAKTMTIASAHTDDRTLTLPDETSTLAGTQYLSTTANYSGVSGTVTQTLNISRSGDIVTIALPTVGAWTKNGSAGTISVAAGTVPSWAVPARNTAVVGISYNVTGFGGNVIVYTDGSITWWLGNSIGYFNNYAASTAYSFSQSQCIVYSTK